jgi:hypothetical protein
MVGFINWRTPRKQGMMAIHAFCNKPCRGWNPIQQGSAQKHLSWTSNLLMVFWKFLHYYFKRQHKLSFKISSALNNASPTVKLGSLPTLYFLTISSTLPMTWTYSTIMKSLIYNWLNPENAAQFFNKLYHNAYVKK